MAYENEILSLMENLVIVDKHLIASLMFDKWKEGSSAVNNANKALTNLVGIGKLVKGNGFFKLPDCKSEYKEHAQFLTKALTEILKTKLVRKIFREISIPEVGLRPDAIVLLEKDGKGLCFILEVVHHETEDYLRQKVTTWKHWNGSVAYLCNLFGVKIPCFDIVVSGSAISGTHELKTYLEEVQNG